MSFEAESFRLPRDEELGSEAKTLATLRHRHHAERTTKWSKASRFISGRTAIILLLVTNVILAAQCLGLWTFIQPLSQHALTSQDALALDRNPSSAAWDDSDLGNSTAKRAMTTALTEPSVSCDLCPAGDDFCMELGSVRGVNFAESRTTADGTSSSDTIISLGV